MRMYCSRGSCLYPSAILALKKVQPCQCFYVHHSVKDETGVLDDFTTQLVRRQSFKWEYRKSLVQSKIKHRTFIPIENSIKNEEFDDVDALFQKAIDSDNSSAITDLTKQCIRCDKAPSLVVLIHALSLCSRSGDKDTVGELAQLCEKLRPEFLEGNSNFEHYKAEAIWIKGDITKSLQIFEKVYKENMFLRSKIRSVLKYLILNSIAVHSEATLVNLLQFSEMLAEQYKDFFTLGCLWQACMLSEWFADHQIALGLLDKYESLCNIVAIKIPFIVKISLKQDRTEVVYRLTEVLLKFKRETELCQVILSLIDYWIRKGDFRQCKEITSWTIQNDLKLPYIYRNKKLVELLTGDVKDVENIFEPPPPKQTPKDFKF